MDIVDQLLYQGGTREQYMPGFTKKFPYYAICSKMDKGFRMEAPWHWHRSVELFYMEKGSVEYFTPGGKFVIAEGCCGFLGASVLHRTALPEACHHNLALLHLFEPVFLSGGAGSLIDQKYVLPFLDAAGQGVLILRPDVKGEAEVVELLRRSFELQASSYGYEFHLRAALSEIWLRFLEICPPKAPEKLGQTDDGAIKNILSYIYDHYSEKIDITDLAKAGHCSERECYRSFQEYLHMTPVQYIRSWRLERAAELLASGEDTVADIALACGFGSSSRFGKMFREAFSVTPLAYRLKLREEHSK